MKKYFLIPVLVITMLLLMATFIYDSYGQRQNEKSATSNEGLRVVYAPMDFKAFMQWEVLFLFIFYAGGVIYHFIAFFAHKDMVKKLRARKFLVVSIMILIGFLIPAFFVFFSASG